MRKTRQILHTLKQYESQNITWIDPGGGWPIVWAKAKGVNVWDVEGKKYTDLSAGFGVCATGYSNPRLVQAAHRQLRTLMHGMGDVHPHLTKVQLARALSKMTFERWSAMGFSQNTTWGSPHGKVIFCNSGFEAVEAALKTAYLATGRPGVVAFEGAYHGVGYGALNVTHRDLFRQPFLTQLGQFGEFVPFPTDPTCMDDVLNSIERLLKSGRFGAVLMEPIQGRGGIRIPPRGFLLRLRQLCNHFGSLLILDEIFTGFGRTGKWFACEHDKVAPDIICLGKALTGGFPLSACVGRAEIMDKAWPVSSGEAIHTSTFLGHPVGCAMALANIAEIKRLKLVSRAEKMGKFLIEKLSTLKTRYFQFQVRGKGLMIGIELWRPDGAPASSETFKVVKQMLNAGFILLPEGSHGNVLSITPPLTIDKTALEAAVKTLNQVFQELCL